MRKTYRSIQKQLFSQMLGAVESKELPVQLSAARESLRQKILAEIEHQDSLFEFSDEIYRTPSMGLVELSHESLPESISLFATDIRCKDIVRIKVYSACKNLVTGLVEKEGLISEVIMSETQLGNAIMNTSCGTGYPVTMLVDNGKEVEPYDESKDVTKRKMQELMQKINSHSSQVNKFMQELEELLKTGREKGRLGKNETKRAVELLKMVTDYSVSNGAYDLTLLTEEMFKRTNEAVLNLNVSGKLLMLSHKE